MHYKNAKKFEEKKALIHLSPLSRKHISYFFCDIWPLCVFSALCNPPKKETIFNNFFWNFFAIINFRGFLKVLRVTSLLLLNIWNWRGFLVIVAIPHFSIFDSMRFFRNFHLVKEYPLAFIANFGLRKVVLRAETRFAIIERYQKTPKIGFLWFLWGKIGFLVSGVFLEVIFGTEKMAKLEIRSSAYN